MSYFINALISFMYELILLSGSCRVFKYIIELTSHYQLLFIRKLKWMVFQFNIAKR